MMAVEQREKPADPINIDDDMLLECVVAANYEFIVTRNVKDFRPSYGKFGCSRCASENIHRPIKGCTMTTLTARLPVRPPNSIHQRIKELAQRDSISINQFIASAAAEKMASVMTLDYLRSDASQGQRSAFEHYLSNVPDSPAQRRDERVT